VRLVRLQIAAALALVAVAASSLAWLALVSPSVSFVLQHGDALWIASPDPVSHLAVVARPDALPVVEFVRRFEADPSAGPLRLRVQALRGFELALNGRSLAARHWNEGSWRRATELEVRHGLVPGTNELRVRVRNPAGPPLLRLSAEGAGVRLGSDAQFRVRQPGGRAELAARRADDRLRTEDALATPGLLEGLRARRAALGLAFAAGIALSLALRSPAGRRLRALLPGLVAAAIAALWLSLFALRAAQLPESWGFDGPDHLAYVPAIRATGSLPLPYEGRQTHHPPLYYALSAAVLAALEPAGVPPRFALRLIPLASGVAQICVALALARRLFPGDRLLAASAALTAALLPLNLYMSSYIGNEPLHGALAALVLLLTAGALLAPRVSGARLAGIGMLLGLAILTKLTSLLLVPLCALFVAARDLRDGLRPAPLLGRVGLLAGSAAAVCGGYFVRNQLRTGQALARNWTFAGEPFVWWQTPGFHTPAYYLRFGGGLARPFFASFESFWDGLYSTAWGDGFAGGVSAWGYRHAMWDWDAMGATYALAMPATVLALVGLAMLAREAFRGDDERRRIALSFVGVTIAATVLSLLELTMLVPMYSMTKASYALSLAAPLSLTLALGFTLVHRRLGAPGAGPLQALLHGWAAALAAAIALAFVG
jgi:hypothetical protein